MLSLVSDGKHSQKHTHSAADNAEQTEHTLSDAEMARLGRGLIIKAHNGADRTDNGYVKKKQYDHHSIITTFSLIIAQTL